LTQERDKFENWHLHISYGSETRVKRGRGVSKIRPAKMNAFRSVEGYNLPDPIKLKIRIYKN
jgi:hypothetical protein